MKLPCTAQLAGHPPMQSHPARLRGTRDSILAAVCYLFICPWLMCEITINKILNWTEKIVETKTLIWLKYTTNPWALKFLDCAQHSLKPAYVSVPPTQPPTHPELKQIFLSLFLFSFIVFSLFSYFLFSFFFFLSYLWNTSLETTF